MRIKTNINIFLIIAFTLLISCAKTLVRGNFYTVTAQEKSDIVSSNAVLKAFFNGLPVLRCSANAIGRDKNTYLFITASHCVSTYDEATHKVTKLDFIYTLTLERTNGRSESYVATVVSIGNPGTGYGYDLALLQAEINEVIPVLEISDTDPELGDDVYIAHTPMSQFGVLLIRGYVSRYSINEVVVEGISWENDSVMQFQGLGFAQGASGSIVYGCHQKKVVAVLVGSGMNGQGHISVIVIPASRVNHFVELYKNR
ncbi:MAG: serine protease [bacterium]|nr:serine protease [bacterium]